MENTSPENDLRNQTPSRPKNWLVESILVSAFCCLPFGIIAIINAAKVNTQWAIGDYAGAVQSAARAKKWVLIGFSLGLFIIGSLLVINVYLYSKYYQRNSQSRQITEQLSTDSLPVSELNMEYRKALATIESYKGQNGQADIIIAMKEKALGNLKNNPAALQDDTKISKAEYDRQVVSLHNIVNDFQNQITKLQQQNKVLLTKNDSLGNSLAQQILNTSQRENTHAAFPKTSSLTSLLKPTSINATGILTKSSGAEDQTDIAKKAEGLKVCWTIPANELTDAGETTFYVRIINPDGLTLAAESAGSGVIKDAHDNSPIQYTNSTIVNYQKQERDACAEWRQTAPYSKGIYIVNIYEDGYLVGTQKLELK